MNLSFIRVNFYMQFSEIEKQEILEFEGHLANKTITEDSTLLLSQLISRNAT